MQPSNPFWYDGEPSGCGVIAGLALIIGLVLGFAGWADRIAQQDAIACRQQGLDAIAKPFPSLHKVCVPRAGHGVDTIYIAPRSADVE